MRVLRSPPSFWLLVSLFPVLFKIWPTALHYNPQIVLACYLGSRFTKAQALIGVILCALLSDLASSYVSTYGAFGAWTGFTYSALLIITISTAYAKIHCNEIKFLGCTLGSGLFFWIWTNWGVWLNSTVYAHTVTGLLQCYVMALPFLENSIIAILLWTSLIVGFYLLVNKQKNICIKKIS